MRSDRRGSVTPPAIRATTSRPQARSSVSRRISLAALAWLLVGLALADLLHAPGPAPTHPVAAATNPIITENQHPGTTTWRLANDPEIQAPAEDVHQQIKGY